MITMLGRRISERSLVLGAQVDENIDYLFLYQFFNFFNVYCRETNMGETTSDR